MPCGVRFRADDLRPVRRVTARWAVQAGLPAARAEDFVIAVSEIAANAVRYGSPAARLLLRVAGGAAQAEVRDSGCWRPAAAEAPVTGAAAGEALRWRALSAMSWGFGPGPGHHGDTADEPAPAARAGRAAVTGPGAVVLPAP